MKANAKTNKVSESASVVAVLSDGTQVRESGRCNDMLPFESISYEALDGSTTKSVKPSGEKETANGVGVSLSKNEIFAKLKDFFAPEGLIFDSSEIENQMQSLVTAGVISQAVLITAIEKARKEFQEKNKEAIAAAESISFSDFLEKLKANEQLYSEVLNACKLSEIDESKVFDEGGNIVIYRGAQNVDKDGNARYVEEVCKITDKLGKVHTATVYKELRLEHTVTNYIQAIRYYNNYSDILAKLVKESKSCEGVLLNAANAMRKAIAAGFSVEQITAQL